jgi:hypothetical protein
MCMKGPKPVAAVPVPKVEPVTPMASPEAGPEGGNKASTAALRKASGRNGLVINRQTADFGTGLNIPL